MNDLRFALRMLWKSPGFAAVAVLTLAFGIAVNANLFALVSAFFLQPLPIPSPHEVVMVLQRSDTFGMPHGLSYPDFKDLRERNQVFADLAASLPSPAHIGVAGLAPERTWVEVVSPNYFSFAGLSAALGRTFRIDEGERAGDVPVTVLSHRYWQRRFGGDPQIVGRVIQINGQPFTVVGVTPEHYGGMQWAMALSAFIPSTFAPQFLSGGQQMLTERGMAMWRLYGRLKPGVPLSQARAELAGLADQIKKDFPDPHKGWRVIVFPETRCRPDPAFADFIWVFATLFTGMVALILFIACANVANLMFSRALARQRELSLRAALGAGRWQLIRQMLIESLVLAAIAGVIGVLFAEGAGQALARFTPQSDIPINTDHSSDWRLYLFTACLAAVAGIAAGLMPALKASKFQVFEMLKEAGSGRLSSRRHPVRNLLVVSQVTLSLVVLICAGLFMQSLTRFKDAPLGLRPDHLLIASVDLGLQRYSDDRGRQFHQQLLERVRALPGVVGADVAQRVPFDTGFGMQEVQPESSDPNAADQYTAVGDNTVSAGYFATAGTPILRGRGFTGQDRADAPRVAVINEALARKFWPNQDAVGRRFRTRGNPGLVEVVGVVPTGKYLMLGEDPRPYLYLPMEQDYRSPISLLVRTTVDPASLVDAVRVEVNALDPNLPLFNLRTFEEHVRTSALGLMPIRLGATMACVQGVIGLFLAIMGLYAVVSYGVNQRTQEIGIRMALGAQRFDVLRLVVRQGMRLTLVGVGLGLVMAAGASFVFSKVLYGVQPLDGPVFVGITLLLAGVAALACYLPARRATKVDPMVALRCE
jgi:predicted permease